MKLLLVSHGQLASGILTSYQMIAGESAGIDKLELTDSGVGAFRKALDGYLSHNDKVLILADVQGGTPYNESFKQFLSKPDRVRVVSGLNLAMLLEIGVQFQKSEHLEELATIAVDTGRNGISVAVNDDSDTDDEIEF